MAPKLASPVWVALQPLRPYVLPLALGLLLRAALVWWLPYYWNDSVHYDRLAWNLAEHGAYSLDAEPPLRPATLRPPVYPAFLACVHLVSDRLGLAAAEAPPRPGAGWRRGTPWAVPPVAHALSGAALDLARCGQIALDLATILLAALTLACLLPTPRAGVAAAWALSLCPFTAVFCGAILTECLATFFCVLTLYACARWRRDRSPRALLTAGLAAGLGGLTRAELPLFALIPVVAALLEVRGSWRARARVVLLAAAPPLLLVAPWLARSQALTRSVVGDAVVPVPFLPRGYLLWLWTWLDDPALVQRAFQDPVWIGARTLDPELVPARAWATSHEREEVVSLMARAGARGWSAELDAEFGRIAREKIRRQPFRFALAPVLRRLPRPWLTSRTEMFPLPGWGQARRTWSLLFWKAAAWGLNLGVVVLGMAGLALLPRDAFSRWLLWAPVALRTGLLALAGLLEPRYVIEAYPLVLGAASLLVCGLAARRAALLPRG